MNPAEHFRDTLARAPITALAPMQDVTDLPFWRLMAQYGGPDLYVTEYFRVREGSRLEKPILKSIKMCKISLKIHKFQPKSAPHTT